MRTISVLKDSSDKAGRNNQYTGFLEAGLQSSTLLICLCDLLKCPEEEVVRSHENVRERESKDSVSTGRKWFKLQRLSSSPKR